jgi:uncharacterized protein
VLFLSIQELELRKIRFDEDFPAGEIDYNEDQLRQVGNLHAEGEAELLNNTLGEIRVRGRVNVELELRCDRCLEPLQYPINEPFDLFYRPAQDAQLPHDAAIDEGESQIGFYEGGGIELSEILREHVLLLLPMHAVCQEECAGICPKCGQNLNTTDCSCTEEIVDDRWEALRALRGGSGPGSSQAG